MENQRWPIEQANTWYKKQPWLVGCNFIPSTAINQLEMWQADTFDPEVIDRELGWAAKIGFNSMRVFLHDLLWLDDAAGFKERIGRYLEISYSHGIKTMFVFFDDCWHDDPKLGKQPEPVPGIHGSGWAMSPGTKATKHRAEWGRLEDYVSDIASSFGTDERVIIWDMYNEPANYFLPTLSLPKVQSYAKLLPQLAKYLLLPSPAAPLLKAAFSWARAANPSQPLTAGLWYLKPNWPNKLNELQMVLSDVITFHTYFDLATTTQLVNDLKSEQRPVLCTEYLSRHSDCLFETHLPYFKQEKIGAYNWGLVSGKTQTIYGWEAQGGTEEPEVWFHDILRSDGRPFSQSEVDLIRELTQSD